MKKIDIQTGQTPKIAIIDTEGISVKNGGSKRRKKTTLWIKKGFISVFNIKTKKTEDEYEFVINFPAWKTMDVNTKNQWTYSHQWHQQTWDKKGESYIKVMKKISKMLIDVDVIYAKGKFLEERFLNGAGLFGESIIQKDGFTKKYRLTDLNDDWKSWNVKSYDEALYGYYIWIRDFCKADSPYGDIVIYNYEKSLPVPHDPSRECSYFLDNILKYIYK